MKSCRWCRNLNETFLKINGERHCLWWAAGHKGEVLERFAAKARDKRSELKFLEKTIRKLGLSVFMAM